MRVSLAFCVTFCALVAPRAIRADVVNEWNIKAIEVTLAGKLAPPRATRLMAIVQSAVYEAVNAISGRYPAARSSLEAAPGASVEAAVAAANRATLAQLVPAQRAAIETAYAAALAGIPDGPAKASGVAVGEKAAAAVLAERTGDGAESVESYRPFTTPGVYVPTVLPVAPTWPERRPWLLARANEFRPGPPPALSSEQWARDYNEVKLLGAKNSTRRTAEQTDIARFWEGSGPVMYFPIARSITSETGREITQNARLLAAVAQAMDDAAIAIFEAKYHYGFWRPITAIRNGDIDGNEATEREASWVPFIDTPMHPEYPAAHCITAGALAAVLEAEIGAGPAPLLSSSSPTAPGKTRSWTRVEGFVREVENARIFGGIHYRNSTETGSAMGKRIGELAAQKRLQ